MKPVDVHRKPLGIAAIIALGALAGWWAFDDQPLLSALSAGLAGVLAARAAYIIRAKAKLENPKSTRPPTSS